MRGEEGPLRLHCSPSEASDSRCQRCTKTTRFPTKETPSPFASARYRLYLALVSGWAGLSRDFGQDSPPEGFQFGIWAVQECNGWWMR